MSVKKFAMFVLPRFRDDWASGGSAGQAHRDARGRNDLKLLSIRCETTPRTPVWRSKS